MIEAREGMGLGHEETGQSLDASAEVNRRLREIPTEHLHRVAARVQILVMQRQAPKAFLRQGTKPQTSALAAHTAGTASRAKTLAEREPSGRSRAMRNERAAIPARNLAGDGAG